MSDDLLREMETAERKAWESLARYKFVMFGYWAGLWVHFNRAGKFRKPNPFTMIVKAARGYIKREQEQTPTTEVSTSLLSQPLR